VVVGQVHDVGDGSGSAVGDGDADGDLAEFVVVEGLEVEGLEELLEQPGRGTAERVVEVGQGVEQARVSGAFIGGGEFGELGGDLGALVFEFGEPGQDPGAQRGDGGGVGVVEVGEGFDFAGVGVFGGVSGPATDVAGIEDDWRGMAGRRAR
jgi:hypothetical protein